MFNIFFSDLIMDQLINNKMLEEDLKDEIRNVFISHHTFAHQSRRRRSLMPGSDSKKGFGRGMYHKIKLSIA